MRKILLGTVLLLISASASAGTYQVEGVTIHVPSHCASPSCVSVAAPGYGFYHGGRRLKAHKERGDAKTVAVSTKKDRAPVAPAAAPAVAPAATTSAVDPVTPAKAPDAPAAAAPDAPAAK